jgi:hypothetical protein
VEFSTFGYVFGSLFCGIRKTVHSLIDFTRYAQLDGAEIEKTRKGIPVYDQRRFEVYPDVSEGKVKYEDD